MKLLHTSVLLLLGLWVVEPAEAVAFRLPGWTPVLANTVKSKKKQKSKKDKQKKKRSEDNEDDDEEDDNDDDNDGKSERDPVLGKHPIPVYTDYSKLNISPKQLEKSYRQREFKAYLPHGEHRAKYKTNNYSSFENPTGIAFNSGDSVSIRMAGKPRTQVEFVVQDFRENGRQTRFPLAPGTNNFTLDHAGHGYVNYRDPNPETAPAIKVQIKGGYINGVFTQHDDARVWKYLLRHAKSEIFDILGERTQWILDIKALRESCPEKGPELVALYDRQMTLEQQLLGWEWEGIHPGSHIMGRVMWKGYMHADGLGGAFHESTTKGLANVDQVKNSGAWGTSHEFGHVNQTRPGMLWNGTTEVTVNLFSQLVNLDFNPNQVRLEHEACGTLDNHWVRGGRFDCYVNSALVKRQLWQFQVGPDDGGKQPGERRGDQFVALCPMWQLYLYNTLACGDKLFYPRIFKDVRDTDERQMKLGELVTRYMIRCCDSAKLDLTDFFLQVGMLAPVNRYIEDYSSRWCTITEEMCLNVLKHASKYPKPESPVIFYITTNNYEIFRDKLEITPTPAFKPELQNPAKPSFVVPADKWENAVAFEVYDKEDNLIRVCLRGLNQKDNKSTEVFLPAEADYVMAVQWDGKRYIMHRKRGSSGVDGRPDPSTGPGQYQAPKDSPKKKKKKK